MEGGSVTDSGPAALTFSSVGTPPTVTSTNFKFGFSSMRGVRGGYYRSAQNLTIGSLPFTIECYIYFDSSGLLTAKNQLIGTLGAATSPFPNQWIFGIEGAQLKFYIGNFSNGAPAAISSAMTLVINRWYHVAMTKDASNVITFFYADTTVANSGTQIGSTTLPGTNNYLIDNNSSNAQFMGSTVVIGGSGFDTGSNETFSGYMDEVRISVNQVRYTAATYTSAPGAAFSNTG